MAGASLGLSSTRSLAPASSLRAAREGKQKPQASQGLGLAGGPSCCTLLWQCVRQLHTAVNSERWGLWGVIWGQSSRAMSHQHHGSGPHRQWLSPVEQVTTPVLTWSAVHSPPHCQISGFMSSLFNVLKKDIWGVDFEVMTQHFKRTPVNHAWRPGSMGHTELCCSVANFLTFVRQWHPQASLSAVQSEITGSFLNQLKWAIQCVGGSPKVNWIFSGLKWECLTAPTGPRSGPGSHCLKEWLEWELSAWAHHF